ncbi:phage portal protein [Solibacillus sp. FSL W8-0474]|uniref:phage portal protein n=1 Tax=Solibacillus sp. FSL W8-0474 TaxID=2975336 RepID=UPI0030FA3FA3
MSTFYKYAEILDAANGVPTPEVLAEIIADHMDMNTRTAENYGRYKQEKEHTPILTREFEGEAAKKINNKLSNDYFGEIVDTKVGYMFGMPVGIQYDKDAPGYATAIKAIERFRKINNLDDLNAEWCKFSSISGYDAGLCYIDKEGKERVMRIDPWEAIVISKTTFTEPEYGLVYYPTWEENKVCVEFYNAKTKYIFEGADFSNLILNTEKTKPHMFNYCPLFGIPNNEELQGDGDKVFTLIDGFDRAMSDMNSEIEQFRLAYMIFIGYEPDEETLALMMRTGALYIPTSEDGEKIEWLTKDLNPAYIDSHLDRLEALIQRFAKHINFTDAAFGSQITGPAMRYKLFALETKSKYFERKHEAAMLYMFKVIGSAWQTKGFPFDYAMIDCIYTRNIPANLLDEAQTATALSAIASKRTALSVVSVINDVDEELRRMEDEKEIYGELDLDNLNTIPNKDNPENAGGDLDD